MADPGKGGGISFRGEEHPAAMRRTTRAATEIAAARERAAMKKDVISSHISLYVPVSDVKSVLADGRETSQILILDARII
jgi:hypothetical protein